MLVSSQRVELSLLWRYVSPLLCCAVALLRMSSDPKTEVCQNLDFLLSSWTNTYEDLQVKIDSTAYRAISTPIFDAGYLENHLSRTKNLMYICNRYYFADTSPSHRKQMSSAVNYKAKRTGQNLRPEASFRNTPHSPTIQTFDHAQSKI